MSYTSYAVNDALAQKRWSKELMVMERDTLDIAPLFGTDANSIIQVKNELTKGPGDQITFGLRARLTGRGFSEADNVEGNGEALSTYSQAIVINELGHNVKVKSENTIDAQRVGHDLRDEARDALAIWHAERTTASFFNQVCGNVAQSDTYYTGMQATTAHTTGRKIFAGSASADEGLTSNDIFQLDLIDDAVEMAKTGVEGQRMNPVRVGGRDMFVLYLHPFQVTAMRKNYSAGQWGDLMKAALMAEYAKSHPIFTNALGEYHGVVLRESLDIPLGCNSSTGAAVSNTRRAVLLGAQAAVAAFGQKTTGPTRYFWNEELLDHKRKLEVSAKRIWGLKKSQFSSNGGSALDFGALTISTYAAAAA